jgi:hypothetical protein
MNTYTWFKIFNKTEFEATGLVSRSYRVFLNGVGERTILSTKGNYLSVLFDEVFLPINLNSNNPFEMDERAVYLDANNDVWVGILNES